MCKSRRAFYCPLFRSRNFMFGFYLQTNLCSRLMPGSKTPYIFRARALYHIDKLLFHFYVSQKLRFRLFCLVISACVLPSEMYFVSYGRFQPLTSTTHLSEKPSITRHHRFPFPPIFPRILSALVRTLYLLEHLLTAKNVY